MFNINIFIVEFMSLYIIIFIITGRDNGKKSLVKALQLVLQGHGGARAASEGASLGGGQEERGPTHPEMM